MVGEEPLPLPGPPPAPGWASCCLTLSALWLPLLRVLLLKDMDPRWADRPPFYKLAFAQSLYPRPTGEGQPGAGVVGTHLGSLTHPGRWVPSLSLSSHHCPEWSEEHPAVALHLHHTPSAVSGGPKTEPPGSYRQPEFIDSAVPFATGSSPTSAPCRLVFVQSLDLHPAPVALLGSPDFRELFLYP